MTELNSGSSNGIYGRDLMSHGSDDGHNRADWEGLPETDWSLMGSDLRIASVDELEADTTRQLEGLKALGDIRPTDVDTTLLEQGGYVQQVYEQQLKTLEADYPQMAKGLQSLVIEELSRREQSRGVAYAQGSFDSYRENIATIEELMTDLQADIDVTVLDPEELAEAKLADTYLRVWRKDMTAELTVKEIQRIYALAA